MSEAAIDVNSSTHEDDTVARLMHLTAEHNNPLTAARMVFAPEVTAWPT